MKNQKGITLIALVVTIVVLLILAGTSIAMLSGENGIITQAKEAQVANVEGDVVEKIDMAYNTIYTIVLSKVSVDKSYDPTDEAAGKELAETVLSELGITDVSLTETPAESNTYIADDSEKSGYVVTYTYTPNDEGNGNDDGTIEIKYTDANFTDAETDSSDKYDEIKSVFTLTTTKVEKTDPYVKQVNQTKTPADET